MCHDWPVESATVYLPIRTKGNSKCISGNQLSPLLAQNKDIGAALQTLLTRIRLHLQHSLHSAAKVLKYCHEKGYIFRKKSGLSPNPSPPPHHQIWLFFVVSYWPFSVPNADLEIREGTHSVLQKRGPGLQTFFFKLKRYSQEDF